MGWDRTEEPGEPSREPSAGFVQPPRDTAAAQPPRPAPKPPAQHTAPAERWRTNACSQAKPVTGSSFYFQDHQHCLCYCLEYFEVKKRGDALPCNLFTTPVNSNIPVPPSPTRSPQASQARAVPCPQSLAGAKVEKLHGTAKENHRKGPIVWFPTTFTNASSNRNCLIFSRLLFQMLKQEQIFLSILV